MLKNFLILLALVSIYEQVLSEDQFSYENDCKSGEDWLIKTADTILQSSYATIGNQSWHNEMKDRFVKGADDILQSSYATIGNQSWCNEMKDRFMKSADDIVQSSYATIGNQSWWNEMKNSFIELDDKLCDYSNLVARRAELVFEDICQFSGQLYDNVMSLFWYLVSHLAQLSWNISWTVVFATFKNLPYWTFPVVGFFCIIFANYTISCVLSLIFKLISWTLLALLWRLPKFTFEILKKNILTLWTFLPLFWRISKSVFESARKCYFVNRAKIHESIINYSVALLKLLIVNASLALVLYLEYENGLRHLKVMLTICKNDSESQQCEYQCFMIFVISIAFILTLVFMIKIEMACMTKIVFPLLKMSTPTDNIKKSNPFTPTDNIQILGTIPPNYKVLVSTVCKDRFAKFTTSMVIEGPDGVKNLVNIPDFVVGKRGPSDNFESAGSIHTLSV